ncbi:hypothetical protein [Pseudomonas fluorescens]|uniref:hypothetical protein n=1 Tax=Pseudomonas fluorescens TaxID=294 RepID=UPI0005C51AE9|nr:hypothetical protein [Pseudomonas fluorescens]
MANRSKKVVLSARVDPYLKASLELAAAAKNQKIVKMLETILESGLDDLMIDSPFEGESERISFMLAFTAIWSESEPLYKLRAGTLGPKFAGEHLAFTAIIVHASNYFDGDFDLFGDLNGRVGNAGLKPRHKYMINLELLEKEWPTVERYQDFLMTNKPFEPSYEDFKRMLKASEAK